MNFIITNKNDESKPCVINSKDIICPECKECAKIDIKDYKIFFQCSKGGHNIGNIFLNRVNAWILSETQKRIYFQEYLKNRKQISFKLRGK